jgi:predicted phage terminase large subunit-like protein
MMAMMPTLTPEDAKRELARRELARRRLVKFSEYVAPYYRAAAHHCFVAELLEQVETYIRTRGRVGIGRLLIFEPPRHGKSEQASRHFPAWVLGRNPNTRVILTSYGADLATKNSRAARGLVMSQEYQAIFGGLAAVDAPVSISDESRSVEAWDLAAPHRGGMVAAGVGGAITGTGANLFIVDDPIKNREEAESEANRERIWEWWTSTAYTRLEDGAAVVGMLTRWHSDDWAGRLIRAMANDARSDRWVVVNMPAIWETPQLPDGKTWDELQHEKMLEGLWVEPKDLMGRAEGQALWQTKYSVADLERIRINIGSYDFEALYQQQPYLRSGEFFRREWFTVTDVKPAPETIAKRVRYWDKAGTKTGSGGDYAVGVLMCLTKDDRVFVEHVARRQCTPMNREQMILQTARDDANRKGPNTMIWHQQDPGSAGLDSAQATSKMLAKFGFSARFETVTGDKEVRAGPFSTACQGGHVLLLRDAWNQAFVDELVSFPKGNHDDQVDSASGAYSKTIGRMRRSAVSYEG